MSGSVTNDMATGYSGKLLVDKLGLKSGMAIAVIDPPTNFAEIIGELPADLRSSGRLTGHRDLVLIFVTRSNELARRVPALIKTIAPDGMVWVAWPKRSSKIDTDMTEDVIREIVLPSGLVDVKVCAIDELWSGLKLVIRKELR